MLPAHLRRLAMTEQSEQRERNGVDPLADSLGGGSSTLAIHQPRGNEPAIGKPIAQNGCTSPKSNGESPGRCTSKPLGEDHDVCQIEECRDGQHAGQVQHARSFVSELVTAGDHREKKAENRQAQCQGCRAPSCELASSDLHFPSVPPGNQSRRIRIRAPRFLSLSF